MKQLILSQLTLLILVQTTLGRSQLFVNDFDFEEISCYSTYYDDAVPADGWVIEVEAIVGDVESWTQMYTLNDFYNEFSITYNDSTSVEVTMYACDVDGSEDIGATFVVGMVDDDNAHYLYDAQEFVNRIGPDEFCDWASCDGVQRSAIVPSKFGLQGNYPNPFNPGTNIEYSLGYGADIELSVFTIKGELVSTLFKGFQAEGAHTVYFEAGEIAAGVYLASLKTPAGVFSTKLLLLK